MIHQIQMMLLLSDFLFHIELLLCMHPSVFINAPPAVNSVLNFLSAPTDNCAIDTKFPLGALTMTLTGSSRI